jgi:uncharacterized protein YukJ
MPIQNYGVLKGRPIDRRLGTGDNPHYQVHVIDETTDYRIAVNVKSQIRPSELKYLVLDGFDHPLTGMLETLPIGFKALASEPGGLALDFIRENLFDPEQMKILPANVAGPDNDLNELIDGYMQRAIGTESATICAFGAKWGPEHAKDKIFGFSPGNGIHDIHMNQGSVGRFEGDNGAWQDGGLLLHFPDDGKWVALFLAFQSQKFHTTDPGQPQPGAPLEPEIPAAHAAIRIIAALVNPPAADPGKEAVILHNASPAKVNLDGWMIADRLKKKLVIKGLSLGAWQTTTIQLSGNDVQLANDGGVITVLDPQGIKVHGVSYTKADASREGWTIVF